MIEVVCKTDDCEGVVVCEEEVTAVTCSYCCATLGMSSDN